MSIAHNRHLPNQRATMEIVGRTSTNILSGGPFITAPVTPQSSLQFLSNNIYALSQKELLLMGYLIGFDLMTIYYVLLNVGGNYCVGRIRVYID